MPVSPLPNAVARRCLRPLFLDAPSPPSSLLSGCSCRPSLCRLRRFPRRRPGQIRDGWRRRGRQRRSRIPLTLTLIPSDATPLPVCARTTPHAPRPACTATHHPPRRPPCLSCPLCHPHRSVLCSPLEAHHAVGQRGKDGVVRNLTVTGATSATPAASSSSFALSCSNWVDELQNDETC